MNQKIFLAILLSCWAPISLVAGCSSNIGCTNSSSSSSSSCSSSNSGCTTSVNTWLPRAFSNNSAREIILEKTVFQTESHREEWNGTFTFGTEYMQNFGSNCKKACKSLGAMPFWSGTNTMTVGDNSGNYNLDAYQFGLGNIDIDAETNIGGTITLDPKVRQVGTDFMLYFTQRKDEHGLFFKIHAPLGAIMIDPRLSETNIVPNGLNFSGTSTRLNVDVPGGPYTFVWADVDSTGTISQSFYPGIDNRYNNLVSAFAGGIGADCSLDGHCHKPIELCKGRIAPCKQTEIRVADLSVSLGYNVWANEKGLVGIAFKATCPTGNVPTADYALEPIFGRGGAWGVGGEIMSHYKVWANDEDTRYLDIWLQGEVLHLFQGRKPNMRSFDLKQNGPGSKYLLLQYYEAQSDNTRVAKELTQAVNITTLPVISKIAVEGSVALMFDFHCHNWNLGIGGEFWGRSREKLAIDFCSAIDQKARNLNDYAVVGRQVSAYDITSTTPPYEVVANLCDPLATISKSANTTVLVGAPAHLSLPTTLPDGVADATIAANRIPANLNDALNISGAQAARAFTGKVFADLGYTFAEHRYAPVLSVFGGAEFTNKNDNAVQFWSVGLHGALNF